MGQTTQARVDTIYIPSDLRCNRCKETYYTEFKKRANDIDHFQRKYRTAPLDKFTDLCNRREETRRHSDTTQVDYIRRHLLFKSGVDRSSSDQWLFQTRKVSIRNYTPKVIDQEINMGMWI